MRNANTEKVEISDSRELKEQLLGEEIPQRIPGGADAVGDVRHTPSRIDERLLVLDLERDASTIVGGDDKLPPQYELDDDPLIDQGDETLEYTAYLGQATGDMAAQTSVRASLFRRSKRPAQLRV